MISKSQIDKLGQRLKEGDPTAEDITLLDTYRRQFAPAYSNVIADVAGLGYAATGRPSKSTRSIIDKLRRESCRLSQIQDIAGCRIVVPGILEQEQLVSRISSAWTDIDITDRRQDPSHGYRAVHVICRQGRFQVEVQIRTAIQHKWAETSEKLSDQFGTEVKYGGGPPRIQELLDRTSGTASLLESAEQAAMKLNSEMFETHTKAEELLTSVGAEHLAQVEAVVNRSLKTMVHAREILADQTRAHRAAVFKLLESLGSLKTVD